VYDKEGKLHYDSFPEKHTTKCWEHFQMSGQGPYFGQLAWFANFHHEKLPSAIERYTNEIIRVTGVIDTHLKTKGTEYLVGDKITYADLMFVPWYDVVQVWMKNIDLSKFDAYTAWVARLQARPSAKKFASDREKRSAEFTD
jgi:glutathione S-transferase